MLMIISYIALVSQKKAIQIYDDCLLPPPVQQIEAG